MKYLQTQNILQEKKIQIKIKKTLKKKIMKKKKNFLRTHYLKHKQKKLILKNQKQNGKKNYQNF